MPRVICLVLENVLNDQQSTLPLVFRHAPFIHTSLRLLATQSDEKYGLK